jgi:ubiquinone/menaquinone biosynthesis C-methylase UbiE
MYVETRDLPQQHKLGHARERLTQFSAAPNWIRFEHEARYNFAAQYAKAAVICECACGSGLGTKRLIEAGAAYVYGFDISMDALFATQEMIDRSVSSIGQSDSISLPLPDNAVDVYVSLETIEHVQDAHALLREATRVLKPGGLFICSTPNRSVTNPGKTITDKPWNTFHVREYSLDEFDRLLAEYFGHVEMFGLNYEPQAKIRFMEKMSSLGLLKLAVRLNQISKLPRLVFPTPHHHCIRPVGVGEFPEYLVALCHLPL